MENAVNFNWVHSWFSVALVEHQSVMCYMAWVPKWPFYICCYCILNRVDKCFESPFAVFIQGEHLPGIYWALLHCFPWTQTSWSPIHTCFPCFVCTEASIKCIAHYAALPHTTNQWRFGCCSFQHHSWLLKSAAGWHPFLCQDVVQAPFGWMNSNCLQRRLLSDSESEALASWKCMLVALASLVLCHFAFGVGWWWFWATFSCLRMMKCCMQTCWSLV